MGKLKEALKRYKWIIVGGLSIAILAGVITANIKVFQLMSYKMQANTPAVIELMEHDLKSTKNQNGWCFSEGMEYLLQDMSEEVKVFFETHSMNLFQKFKRILLSNIISAIYSLRIKIHYLLFY